ncbi:CUN014 similar to AcMNPV ORF92 [Culex nigripalpus nucleopolyhedrovirus]|uniref:CUN014 similar to AcMNPV ORF92 n=2 Tax=Deltabaculovirus TaxID=558019 RepID=Q77GU0_NPVCO|nr:CUN014 similar to AcMNPV ORF92 [Culex nigripalpus nucleopolyhedrovirus]AAK13284.1 putative 33 kD early protein [Culex nigripalpus nucleopolyhedrovirus]AAK94092.1 CUN014 similar to AcMNPV ORF92 [Culex nigripalpus nucleopolyhedrovirus]
MFASTPSHSSVFTSKSFRYSGLVSAIFTMNDIAKENLQTRQRESLNRHIFYLVITSLLSPTETESNLAKVEFATIVYLMNLSMLLARPPAPIVVSEERVRQFWSIYQKRTKLHLDLILGNKRGQDRQMAYMSSKPEFVAHYNSAAKECELDPIAVVPLPYIHGEHFHNSWDVMHLMAEVGDQIVAQRNDMLALAPLQVVHNVVANMYISLGCQTCVSHYLLLRGVILVKFEQLFRLLVLEELKRREGSISGRTIELLRIPTVELDEYIANPGVLNNAFVKNLLAYEMVQLHNYINSYRIVQQASGHLRSNRPIEQADIKVYLKAFQEGPTMTWELYDKQRRGEIAPISPVRKRPAPDDSTGPPLKYSRAQ